VLVLELISVILRTPVDGVEISNVFRELLDLGFKRLDLEMFLVVVVPLQGDLLVQVFTVAAYALFCFLVDSSAVQQFVLCGAEGESHVVVTHFERLVLVQHGVDVPVHLLLHFGLLHFALGNVGLQVPDFVVGFSNLVFKSLPLFLEVGDFIIPVVLYSLLSVLQRLEVVENLFIVFLGFPVESVVLVKFSDQVLILGFSFVEVELVLRDFTFEF